MQKQKQFFFFSEPINNLRSILIIVIVVVVNAINPMQAFSHNQMSWVHFLFWFLSFLSLCLAFEALFDRSLAHCSSIRNLCYVCIHISKLKRNENTGTTEKKITENCSLKFSVLFSHRLFRVVRECRHKFRVVVSIKCITGQFSSSLPLSLSFAHSRHFIAQEKWATKK